MQSTTLSTYISIIYHLRLWIHSVNNVSFQLEEIKAKEKQIEQLKREAVTHTNQPINHNNKNSHKKDSGKCAENGSTVTITTTTVIPQPDHQQEVSNQTKIFHFNFLIFFSGIFIVVFCFFFILLKYK